MPYIILLYKFDAIPLKLASVFMITGISAQPNQCCICNLFPFPVRYDERHGLTKWEWILECVISNIEKAVEKTHNGRGQALKRAPVWSS
jgi:hypothetical protein